jgi:DNA-binding FadR family transcriptional regulator
LRRSKAIARDTNPMEVVEMRIALEPYLVRLAAIRASSFDIARIRRAAKTADATNSGAADLAFHKAIATSTGNKLAATFYGLLRQVGSDARLRLVRTAPSCPKRITQRDSEHRAIAEAIATRDPDAAERAMRVHMVAVQKRVLEYLTPLKEAI